MFHADSRNIATGFVHKQHFFRLQNGMQAMCKAYQQY